MAKSLEGLARNLNYQSKYDEALPAMRLAVALQRRLHNSPHTDLAEALNNLGLVLDDMGEYRESEMLFREALQMKRFLLGDTHTEIALGLNNLASTLSDQKKYDEAEAMYREAIAMQRKLLGDDHPDVAAALNNLAFVLHDKGDTAGALGMMRESLEMYRRTVGAEHPSVGRVHGQRGDVADGRRRLRIGRTAAARCAADAPETAGQPAYGRGGNADAVGQPADRDRAIRGGAVSGRRSPGDLPARPGARSLAHCGRHQRRRRGVGWTRASGPGQTIAA